MDDQGNAIASIKYALEEVLKLQDTAFSQYTALVGQVLENQIIEERQLEQIMDGLLDFCDEDRFVALYRNLCRHIYPQHPQLVEEHISLFREQFNDK